jgi:hypothetical protein
MGIGNGINKGLHPDSVLLLLVVTYMNSLTWKLCVDFEMFYYTLLYDCAQAQMFCISDTA